MVLFSAYAEAGLFGPSNYEECILEKMKGITSDVAARAVDAACRSKFPYKSPRLTDEDINELLDRYDAPVTLSAAQVQNIKNEGVSWTSNGTGLMIKLYNGNSDVAIATIIYRYRINDGKREGNWSNKQVWKFRDSDFNPSFRPYSYAEKHLENLDVKMLPKNFTVSIEIVEAWRL